MGGRGAWTVCKVKGRGWGGLLGKKEGRLIP